MEIRKHTKFLPEKHKGGLTLDKLTQMARQYIKTQGVREWTIFFGSG
jgi:hypothetical protein